MPGDPGSILGVLIGARDEEPTLHLCANPAEFGAVGSLYAQIQRELEERTKEHEWVQIAVGTRADAKALASLAEAAGNFGPGDPWNAKPHKGGAWDPRIVARARMLGAILANPVIVRPASPHQASLVVLADELAEHYATPISDHERAHLGVHLSWLRAGAPYEHEAMAATAIQTPCDNRPLGQLDEEITEARDALKESGDARTLHAIVERTLRNLRALQEEAYDHLIAFDDGECAAWFNQRETEAHKGASWGFKEAMKKMRSHEKLLRTTNYLAGSRRSDARTKRFLRQEHALERDKMWMLRVDSVVRAGARVEGEVLIGEIVTCVESPGRRSSEWVAQVRTSQPLVALDEADGIEVLDRGIKGRVTKIDVENGTGLYMLTFRGIPGEPGERIEVAKDFPFGNINEAISRRIGRDKRSAPDNDGGADPQDDRNEETRERTSRFGGPSWTHDPEAPRTRITRVEETPTNRVDALLAKYQK